MKKAIILIVLTFTVIVMKGQCSIEKFTTDDGTIFYQAEFEDLIKNVGNNNDGDYGVGFQMALARLAYIGIDKSIWKLQVGTSASGIYKKVIPRKITFNFSDGTSLSLTASTFENTGKAYLCDFDLISSDLIYFEKSISKVIVTDTRTGDSFSGAPTYANVLVEQYNCLNK